MSDAALQKASCLGRADCRRKYQIWEKRSSRVTQRMADCRRKYQIWEKRSSRVTQRMAGCRRKYPIWGRRSSRVTQRMAGCRRKYPILEKRSSKLTQRMGGWLGWSKNSTKQSMRWEKYPPLPASVSYLQYTVDSPQIGPSPDPDKSVALRPCSVSRV
jgi:hypothetical protein